MRVFSKLSPKSPDDRRIAICVLFIVVAQVIVIWLQTQVLFSDVRVNIVFDFFQIFGLTLISLAFFLHSNRKEQLEALCVSLVLSSLTFLLCDGKIHAKSWRFKNPGNYSPVVLEELTVKGKTIRKYLIRDQKYPAIMIAKVEPISEQIALYWPLAKFGSSNNANLRVNSGSIVVTCRSSGRVELKVIPLSAIP
ncbi:MAG: hypothetical protein QG574_5086 [Cyanobacteriota bacterium erpe_2018_sw_21hr_WHONDRS-SW48-000092_B_bin.40]|nr:hypothetical protein [Cyanobacteriota bacterium erpe_2018_sw_21hr_WHONDRS-SW48-000092_B_bin.40]